MTQTSKHTFKDGLRTTGVIVGVPFAILADKYLTSTNLQIDYASSALTKKLPLAFFRSASPFLIIGTFANNYSNLGSSIDSIIHSVKTFPYTGSCDDFKRWTMEIKSENVGHVIGAIFGTALGVYFIYCNVTDPNAIFLLSYGQANTIPNWLLQIGAIPYIAGACSNVFSQLTEGSTDFIKASFIYGHDLRERLTNCCLTFFARTSQTPQHQSDNENSPENTNTFSPV